MAAIRGCGWRRLAISSILATLASRMSVIWHALDTMCVARASKTRTFHSWGSDVPCRVSFYTPRKEREERECGGRRVREGKGREGKGREGKGREGGDVALRVGEGNACRSRTNCLFFLVGLWVI